MRFASALKKTLETLLAISIAATPMKLGQRENQELTTIQPGYGQAEIYHCKMQLVDGRPVIEINEYLMGKGVLGVCNTYSGAIHLLEGLKGRDREKVLEHERGHRDFPMRSEEENRRKTYTEDPDLHPLVSYIG